VASDVCHTDLAREPPYRDFGPVLPAEHLERSFALQGSPDTLRSWMMAAGLWNRQRRQAKHRSRSPRRAALGELESGTARCKSGLENRSPAICDARKYRGVRAGL